MIFEKLKSGVEVTDQTFDTIYPARYKNISKIHFTPIEIAKLAAQYLVQKPGTRVLDIGSGAGKFCMVGAACTEGHFTGVEQRRNLHRLAVRLSKKHTWQRVEYIFGNVTATNFEAYDAIYYFNSFYEHIFQHSAIDQTVTLDKMLYTLYTQYMREQLDKMPLGTRLVTYFSFMDEVPDSYKIKSAEIDLKLKFWEKMR